MGCESLSELVLRRRRDGEKVEDCGDDAEEERTDGRVESLSPYEGCLRASSTCCCICPPATWRLGLEATTVAEVDPVSPASKCSGCMISPLLLRPPPRRWCRSCVLVDKDALPASSASSSSVSIILGIYRLRRRDCVVVALSSSSLSSLLSLDRTTRALVALPRAL